MKRKSRRFIGTVLICAMFISAFPLASYGAESRDDNYVAEVGTEKYESLQDAIDVAEASGKTVRILRDVVLDGSGKGPGEALLTINGEVTIDGHGYTISAVNINSNPGETPNIINIFSNETVELEYIKIDGSINDGGKLVKGAEYVIQVQNEALDDLVRFRDVEIFNGDVNKGYALKINDSAVALYSLKTESDILVDNASDFNIFGGDIGKIRFDKSEADSIAPKALIDGGRIKGIVSEGLGSGEVAEDADIKISRGIFERDVEGCIDIASSAFEYLSPESYIEESPYENIYNVDYANRHVKYVASINGVDYEDLQEAIYAANDGDTIELLDDIAIENAMENGLIDILGSHNAIKDKHIIIDGNFHNVDSKYIYNRGKNILYVASDENNTVHLTLKDIRFSGFVWSSEKFLLKGAYLENAKIDMENVNFSFFVDNGLNIKGGTTELNNILAHESEQYAIEVVDGEQETSLIINDLETEKNIFGGINIECKTNSIGLVIEDATISEDNSIEVTKGLQNNDANVQICIKGGSFENINLNVPENNLDLLITGGTFKKNDEFNLEKYIPGDYEAIDSLKNGYVDVKKKENMPSTEHHFSDEWTSDENEHWHACTDENCDAVMDKASHTWDEGVVTTEPTYESEGVRTYTCEVCGATKTESIPILPFDPTEPDDPDIPGIPEEPDDPDTPSIPSEPSTPSEPEEPALDVTTDEEEATTTAKPDVVVSGDVASAVVSEAMGDAMVEQAVANESVAVVVAPEMDEDTSIAEVELPASTVAGLGDDTAADLVVDTPLGTVTLPNAGLSNLASDRDAITVSLESDGDRTIFTIHADDDTVASVDGGVTLVVPADTSAGTVAVIVHDDGTREVVRKSVAAEDRVTIPLDGSATIEVVDNSKDFDDVAANAWYADAVAFASSHELFNGTSATTFSPNDSMTRGMLAAVLANLERGDGAGLALTFNDVADDAWYAEAVAWAADNSIINGYGDNRFGPNDNITREQMAAMLYNYAEMIGLDTSARADFRIYSDAYKISDWADEVMQWAVAEGIINGTSESTLDPQGEATRGQVAAMLQRLVSKITV